MNIVKKIYIDVKCVINDYIVIVLSSYFKFPFYSNIWYSWKVTEHISSTIVTLTRYMYTLPH